MEKLSKNYTSFFAFTIAIQFNRLALVLITILVSPPTSKTVFTLAASICSKVCTEFRFPGVTVLRVCWNQQSFGSWSVSLWPVLFYLSFPSLRRQTGEEGVRLLVVLMISVTYGHVSYSLMPCLNWPRLSFHHMLVVFNFVSSELSGYSSLLSGVSRLSDVQVECSCAPGFVFQHLLYKWSMCAI